MGRQHGMVRTYQVQDPSWDPRLQSRSVIPLTSPLTANIFTKAPPKPTNHSKFTSRCFGSKCHGCHSNPPCKSKDKVKGTRKIRSSCNIHDFRVISWRMEDTIPGMKYTGFSATSVLDYLACEEDRARDFGDGYADDDEILNQEEDGISDSCEIEEIHDESVVDNNDLMSFYEVGFLWQLVEEDESWCLVEEL